MAETDKNREGAPRRDAALAHDIRTALADMIDAMRLLGGMSLPPDARAQIDRVTAAGNVVADLVDDILQPGLEPHAQTTALQSLIEQIGRRWRGRADSLGREFEIRADPGLPVQISADPGKIDRLLGNLIDNAFKHAPSSEVILNIGVSPDRKLRFTVQDRGPGPSDDHTRNGLGLAICADLAGSLGGTIEIANSPGGGLEATFDLPSSTWLEAQPHPPPRPSIQLGGLRVLVAEDLTATRMLLAHFLEGLGATVTSVEDGAQAIDLLRENIPDLALIDIEMPKMNGRELLSAIRHEDGPLADLPVLAITAHARREDQTELLELGAQGALTKPVDESALIKALNALDLTGGRRVREAVQRFAEEAAPQDRADLLEGLASDLRRLLTECADASARRDPNALLDCAHVLLSLALTLNSAPLQLNAQRIDAALRKGDVEGALIEASAAHVSLESAFQEVEALRR